MKKAAFPVLLLVLSVCVTERLQAQAKIGYISIQELVTQMPEFKKASNDLDEYEKALIAQGQEHQREWRRQDSLFNVDSPKWNPSVKDVKRRELNAIYLKVINYNQEAQQQMQARERELLAPIQQKAVQTTQAVAKENGFSYILSKEQLISYPPGDDLLNLVLKKLGIAPPPPATPEKK